MKLKYWLSLLAAGTLAVVLAQVPSTIIRSGFVPGASAQGGSGLVLVEQHTASGSASLAFTTGITSTYDEYLLEVVDLVPASSGANLTMQFSSDGGSTWDAGTNYTWVRISFDGSSAGNAGTGGTSSILLAPAVDSGTLPAAGTFRIFNPMSTAVQHLVRGNYTNTVSADFLGTEVSGVHSHLVAVNALRVLFSTGNVSSGTVRLYGLAK